MPNEVQLRFDYDALDRETRAFVQERAEKLHNLARATAGGLVQMGQYLTEVKERLREHNKGRSRDDQERLGFLRWIELEFAWTDQTARNLIHIYDQFKFKNFLNMEIDVSALYLIAAPSTPEPVRTEVIRRAENGEPVSHAGARALNGEFRQTGVIPAPTKSLAQMINERRQHVTPAPAPAPRLSAEERREEESSRRQREASSARYVRLMAVIEAIETIADTPHTMPEIAGHIFQFDTPDQDWPGQCREAYNRLRILCKELKL